MDKAIRVRLYGEKDGDVDKTVTVTELLRTPSMQGLEEATKAGANVMYVGMAGNWDAEPGDTVTVQVNNSSIPHVATCIAAFIIDSDPRYKHQEVPDWGFDIRGIKRRLIPGLMPEYYKAAYELINAANADVPVETNPKGEGESSATSATQSDTPSRLERSDAASPKSTGSPRQKHTSD